MANMNRFRRLGVALGVACLGLGAGPMVCAQTPDDVATIARALASVATDAEGTAAKPDAASVRSVVEPALQKVIIDGNLGPVKVYAAIRYVLAVCHPVDGKPHLVGDLTCPGAQGSYDVLNGLSRIVQALIKESIQPAAGPVGAGGPAYSTLSTTPSAGSGPAYRSAS